MISSMTNDIMSNPDNYEQYDLKSEKEDELKRKLLHSHPVDEIKVSLDVEDEKELSPPSYLNKASTQILLISFICFGSAGMFNALSSVGGGLPGWAQADNADSQALVMWLFTFCSVLAPSILALIGVRNTVLIGASGYIIYVLSIYNCVQQMDPAEKLIQPTDRMMFLLSSAYLGFCASMLWTAQGAIVMAYPTENTKASSIAIFWFIFNLGGMAGSLVGFVSNYNSTSSGASTNTYICFMIVMGICCSGGLFLAKPEEVQRKDNIMCKLANPPTISSEVKGIVSVFTDRKMLMLVPLFLYTNWCYTYQFQKFNVGIFNTRTTGFNSFLYWGAQMVGAYILGMMLDDAKLMRSTRGCRSFLLVAVIGILSWGWGVKVAYQLNLDDTNLFDNTTAAVGNSSDAYDPSALSTHGLTQKQLNDQSLDIDFKDTNAIEPILLYTVWGFLDAFAQCWSYWIMSNMSDDPATLTRYAGFYKTVQCFGAAIASLTNGNQLKPYFPLSSLNQLLVNCVLFALCLLPSLLVARGLKDPTSLSDEGEMRLSIAPARTGVMVGSAGRHSRGASISFVSATSDECMQRSASMGGNSMLPKLPYAAVPTSQGASDGADLASRYSSAPPRISGASMIGEQEDGQISGSQYSSRNSARHSDLSGQFASDASQSARLV